MSRSKLQICLVAAVLLIAAASCSDGVDNAATGSSEAGQAAATTTVVTTAQTTAAVDELSALGERGFDGAVRTLEALNDRAASVYPGLSQGSDLKTDDRAFCPLSEEAVFAAWGAESVAIFCNDGWAESSRLLAVVLASRSEGDFVLEFYEASESTDDLGVEPFGGGEIVSWCGQNPDVVAGSCFAVWERAPLQVMLAVPSDAVGTLKASLEDILGATAIFDLDSVDWTADINY